MEEQIIIVDEKDNVIGSKPRSQIVDSDIYRVSALFVYNIEGEILLGKRAATKLTIDASEISETKWFTKQELEKLLNETPEIFVPRFKENLFKYI